MATQNDLAQLIFGAGVRVTRSGVTMDVPPGVGKVPVGVGPTVLPGDVGVGPPGVGVLAFGVPVPPPPPPRGVAVVVGVGVGVNTSPLLFTSTASENVPCPKLKYEPLGLVSSLTGRTM